MTSLSDLIDCCPCEPPNPRLPSACDLDTSFATGFVVQMLILPVLGLCIVFAFLLSWFVIRRSHNATSDDFIRRRRMRLAQIRALKVFVAVVFFLYPGLCARTFQVFRYSSVGRSKYLAEDLSIVIGSSLHDRLMGYAWLAMLVYCIGIPVGTVLVLARQRKRIQHDRHDRLLETSFGSLYRQYKTEYWFFEVGQLIRKAILTGGLVLLRPDTPTQILIGILVCLFHLVIVMNCHPYHYWTDGILEQITGIQLLLALLLGLVLRLLKDGK